MNRIARVNRLEFRGNVETLAIIPARGGSKGIPRKNVLPLGGKPLLAYNILAAKASQLVDRVVVSTDNPEIAQVAENFGAKVVWRPAEISGDMASSESALLHTIGFLKQNEDYQPDIIVFLQATSPLTAADDIDGTVQALLDQQADSALAVIPFHYFLWKNDSTGDAVGINHDKRVRLLRQEREDQYLETGAVYVMRTQGFVEAKHRFFGKTVLYEMPPERRWEIDEHVDFRIAEMLIQENAVTNRLSKLPDEIEAVIFDFDGVFTDNKAIVMQDGHEGVHVHRGDGFGIEQLRKTGIKLMILSKETNPVVHARARKVKLPVLQGIDDKWPVLKAWLTENQVKPESVVYLGNDVNDLECIEQVGCGVAVADAHTKLLSSADIKLERTGGNGAVRELCDLILEKNSSPNNHRRQ